MIHSLGILSSGVKFGLHLIHFMTNFELQLQVAAKSFSYFWFMLVRIKSIKKTCPWFLIAFLLFEIFAYITFLFPLKSVLKIKILPNIKTAHFLRNCKHGFAQGLFPLMWTAFKGITLNIFWVRAQTLYTYTESSQKTCTFSLAL